MPCMGVLSVGALITSAMASYLGTKQLECAPEVRSVNGRRACTHPPRAGGDDDVGAGGDGDAVVSVIWVSTSRRALLGFFTGGSHRERATRPLGAPQSLGSLLSLSSLASTHHRQLSPGRAAARGTRTEKKGAGKSAAHGVRRGHKEPPPHPEPAAVTSTNKKEEAASSTELQ